MPRQRIGRTVCVRLARRVPYTENAEALGAPERLRAHAEAGEQHVASGAEIVDPKVADAELGWRAHAILTGTGEVVVPSGEAGHAERRCLGEHVHLVRTRRSSCSQRSATSLTGRTPNSPKTVSVQSC